MVTLLPVNFVALGIVGGGIASALKRTSGIDARGRVLEIVVVMLTCLLTGVSSGLVRGYFGDPSQCWGVFAPSPSSTMMGEDVEAESESLNSASRGGPLYLPVLNTLLVEFPLNQIQLWYQKWDFVLSRLGFVSRRFLCTQTTTTADHGDAVADNGSSDHVSDFCSPSTRTIDPKFYLDEGNGKRCSADMSLVMGVWLAALGVLLAGYAYRRLRGFAAARRNDAGAGGGAARRGRRRPHQD